MFSFDIYRRKKLIEVVRNPHVLIWIELTHVIFFITFFKIKGTLIKFYVSNNRNRQLIVKLAYFM